MCGSGSNRDFWRKIKQMILDSAPRITLPDKTQHLEVYQKIENFCSHPANNRLIMGATALITQPTIDANNKKVDEKTRKISTNRTIAKIIAGTTVGMMVRGGCYKLVNYMTNVKNTSRLSQALIPDKHRKELIKNAEALKKHRNTVSNIIALIVMLGTNFLFDAPATLWLTNKFNEKQAEKEKEKEKEKNLKTKGGIYV